MAYLDRSAWTITADSTGNFFGPQPPENAVDGNLATYWLSTPGYPHYLIIDLGTAQVFDALKYLPASGPFHDYLPSVVEVYVSDDGVNWGSAVGSNTWPKLADGYEYISFPRQNKRYVKVLGVSSTTSTQMACVEVYLLVDYLNRSAWSATASSEYDAAHLAPNVLDQYGEDFSDPATWTGTYLLTGDSPPGIAIPFPHEIVVDMGSLQTIDFIQYTPAVPRFENPIYWGQPVPALVEFWVSVNGVTYTKVGEQIWPHDKRQHFVYANDSSGNPAPQTCRFFKFVAVDDKDRNPATHYLACAEIYAGLRTAGEIYKTYYKAHPTILEDLTPYIPGPPTNGEVDYLRLALSAYVPGNLQLAKLELAMRLWSTASLAWYPEACASVWDFPVDWQSLPLETLTLFVEGQHLNGPHVGASAEFGLVGYRTSIQNLFGFAGPWAFESGDFAPRVSTKLYDVSSGWVPGSNANSVDASFSNLLLNSSLPSNAPTHDDADTNRLIVSDHYYLLVWEEAYVPPANKAYLEVRKVLVPPTDPGLFNLQIDGTTRAYDQGNGGTTGVFEVAAGDHTIGETAGTGTDLSRYSTTYGGDASALGLVVAVAGQTKVGIITNTVRGHRPEAPSCVLNLGPGIEPDFSVAVQPLEP